MQVHPVAPGEAHTLFYGDAYQQFGTWSVGAAPEGGTLTHAAATEAVWRLLEQRGLRDREAMEALLLNGAPLDDETAAVAQQVRARAPAIPRVDDGSRLTGPGSIPTVEEMRPGSRKRLAPDRAMTELIRKAMCEDSSSDDEDMQSAGVGAGSRVLADREAGDGPCGTANDPIVIGAVDGHAEREPRSEKHCRFVGVVVHDGESTVCVRTSKPVTFGKLNAGLVGSGSDKVLHLLVCSGFSGFIFGPSESRAPRGLQTMKVMLLCSGRRPQPGNIFDFVCNPREAGLLEPLPRL